MDKNQIATNLVRILNYFEQQGITKTSFSKAIGYTSTRQLNNVVEGDSTLSGNAIIKMIQEFKVNPNYLFFGIGEVKIMSVEQQENELGAVQTEAELYKKKWESERKRNTVLENKIHELENMYADLLETTNRAVQHYRRTTDGE
ncbi:MAG: hypothetical protein AB7S72_20025 [Draconibacterium sp.]